MSALHEDVAFGLVESVLEGYNGTMFACAQLADSADTQLEVVGHLNCIWRARADGVREDLVHVRPGHPVLSGGDN